MIPNYIHGRDFAAMYPVICQSVLHNGSYSEPRGMLTREILDAHIVLTNPRKCLPVGTGRKLHTAIGCVEALQLMAGESHPELMKKIAPQFEQFMNGEILQGAYGPRIYGQLNHVVDLLKKDPDTRQAVLSIYRREDQDPGLKDVPCTIALQFTLREGKLNMHVRMRSNDAWLGLPYDVFQFCQLQINVAQILAVDPGAYYHTATSLHLYKQHFDAVKTLRPALTGERMPWSQSLTSYIDSVGTMKSVASAILKDVHPWLAPTTIWYHEKIHGA